MDDRPSLVPGLAELGGPAAVDALARNEPFTVTIDGVPIHGK